MSTKKIKWHEARNIGQKIARKAFAHILDPLEAEYKRAAQGVYNFTLAEIGLTPARLMELGLCTDGSSVTITLSNGNGNEIEVHYDAPDKELKVIRPYGYNGFNIESETLYHQMVSILSRLKPFTDKRDALADELQSQVDGKTVTQAMKNWPEAADIIADIMQVGVPAMTIPLEQLLARFLPALPAPKE